MKMSEHWRGYHLIGGNLALDFLNTVGNRLAPVKRIEYLRTQEDLNHWARLAGFTPMQSRRIPLREALSLREALYGILTARLNGTRPRKPHVAMLNRFALRARAGWKLTPGEPVWRWNWNGGTRVAYPLASIAESAAALLTSDDLTCVRQCGDAQCGWLFLDRSQGRRRKWCSMQDCGNRAKVRRFFRKKM